MDPCPRQRKGRHSLSAVLPESSDLDMTLFCCKCGAMRRVAVTGALPRVGSLDDLTAADIERAVRQ